MDDKGAFARATALLASNAFCLIKAMTFIETVQRPSLLVVAVVILIPALGLSRAYAMLEPPRRAMDEVLAIATVVAMLALWVVHQFAK